MATKTGIGVSQTLAIDLAKPGIPKVVYAMQGEGYTRTVSLRIYDDGVEWTPPSDAAYQVSYCKPDGKGGTYSSYTTDSTKPAVEVSGGRLDVVLIPQMLQVAGRVRVEVHMQHAAIMPYAERLSTFTFYVMVQASAESGITSTDYWAEARDDKVVLLTQAVPSTAGTKTAYPNLSVFISTPHKGDTVVGTNGYTATVTKVEGTTVTLQSTGKQWGVPATSVYSQDVTYTGSVDGTNVGNVKEALDKLSARQGVLTVNATYNNTSGAVSADCTYEQISAAVAQKKSVICIVTATLGGKVVIPLSTLSDNAAYFRAPEADGNAMGIRTLALGKNTGTWTMDVDLDKALCFTDEVAFPTVKGETLDLTGLAFWPRDPEVGELVVGANGYTGEVTALAADGDPIITATGERIFTFAASDITYSGTIGETTVANVKAALDALAVGKPLDMTADYVASGATSVEQWATMAKVVNGVASTTEYRVAPGRYYIGSEDMPNGWIVDIIAFWSTTFRAVIAIGGGSEPCPLFKATVTDTVGNSGFPQFGISIYGDNTGMVKWYGEDYYLVPISRKDDKGKFLKCIDFGYPMEWADLPMATAAAAGVIKADAKTGDDVLPVRIDTDGKLWAPQIVDATEEFSASNMDTFMDWAYTTNDTKSEYLVKPGMYRVNEEDTRPTFGVIVDGVGSAKRWAMAMSLGVDIDSTDIRFTSKDTPGGTEELLIVCNLSAKALTIGNSGNLLLPEYTKADKGKVLKYDGFTTMWASLDPVDATADFKASGAASDINNFDVPEVLKWATMAKAGDANSFRVNAGKYFIIDGTFKRYYVEVNDDVPGIRYVTAAYHTDDGYGGLHIEYVSNPGAKGTQAWLFDPDSGIWSFEQLITLPYYDIYQGMDDGKVLKINGRTPEWEELPTIPTATTADAGKIVTVGADGNYALTELPKYDGGVS